MGVTMAGVLCAIALGSNLGPSEQILLGAIATLRQHPQIESVTCSAFYRTAPVGPPQPDYLNGCLCCQTTLSPTALLVTLLAIEAKFGRVRQERWGPRRLDLDLLLYGDRIESTPRLQIPHPRMTERAFVLVPLAEIAPDWVHPLEGLTIDQLAQQISAAGVERVNRMPGEKYPAQSP